MAAPSPRLKDRDPPRANVPAGTSTATKISSLVGIVAAMVLAVLANVLVARHYKRWDWTSAGLYTLSEPTKQTLRSLEQPIEVYVLLANSDPLAISVRQLLEAYRAESPRITVKLTDPDRNPAEFLAVQQRFGVVAGKTDDGRIVTDAPIIVARGDQPHFLSSRDLVEVEDEDDIRTRPKLEQALTGAIRTLTGGERPRACFSAGHGERSIDVGGSAGAAPLRERLAKNNYEVVEVSSDPGEEDHDHPPVDLKTCRVLIIAGPTQPLPPEDVARYRAYIEQGGSAFIAVGQEPNATDEDFVDLKLGDLLSLAGLRLNRDYIFERDTRRRSSQGFGETFMPVLRPHAITGGLIQAEESGLAVVMTMASSLEVLSNASAAPAPLLMTSDQAFGMRDFFTWAKAPSPPAPTDTDNKGPLLLAAATELPKPAGSSAPNGPRLVVVGSAGVIVGANWSIDELRGTAIFVESAITWLTARPAMLDIPQKPSVMTGLRVSEESVAEIFRYVVVYMPLAALLLGTAVYLRRRGTERRVETNTKEKKTNTNDGRGDHNKGEE
ncbi:MAG: GldG family protein [Polyangiaceae bacterium]|nr:GldG family protein [Polyangiaceae bacterium]